MSAADTVAATDTERTSTSERLHEEGLKRDAHLERMRLFGLCSPALILVLVIMVIPVGWLFYLSFLSDEGAFSLEHYQRMIDSKSYARIFRTTFEVSILTTVICCLIGYPLAYFLAQLPSRAANICLLTVLLSVLDLAAGAHLCLACAAAAQGPDQQLGHRHRAVGRAGQAGA